MFDTLLTFKSVWDMTEGQKKQFAMQQGLCYVSRSQKFD